MLRKLSIITLFLLLINVSRREAGMTNCAATCSNGIVYLTIPSNMIGLNKPGIDVLRSENENSLTIFSVRVLVNKDIIISVRLNSTEQSTGGMAATVSTKLKPSHLRRDEMKPLVLFLNATSVCVLFENECSNECSRIPNVISDLSSFFKSNSSISIDDFIAFSNNRTSVYMSTKNCNSILFTDDTYVKSLKNRLNLVYQSLFDVLTAFGFYSSSISSTGSTQTTSTATKYPTTTTTAIETSTTTTTKTSTTTNFEYFDS